MELVCFPKKQRVRNKMVRTHATGNESRRGGVGHVKAGNVEIAGGEGDRGIFVFKGGREDRGGLEGGQPGAVGGWGRFNLPIAWKRRAIVFLIYCRVLVPDLVF